MHPIDLVVIVVYVTACTALGVRLGSGVTGMRGYFLGDSDVPAWAVMLSIVATETSTATFLSVPGTSYALGGNFTFLQLAFGYLAGRFVVSATLLPGYFRGRVVTAYQVLHDRFGGATEATASVLFLVARTLGDGLRLYLAAMALSELVGWGIAPSIAAVGLATIVYTYLGGMKAVIWTDVIQFTVYILGAIVALGFLASAIPGGFGGLIAAGREAGKFRVFDFDPDPSKPYTFWAGLIGGLFLSTATHGTDQMMVQRYLAAKSRRGASGALIASGFVVLAQFALFLLIGVGLAAYYGAAGGAAPPQDRAFARFIVVGLPVGLTGLVVAAIFSAAMSTLSSSLNASAASTVNDLLRPLAPRLDDRALLRASKGFTALWGLAQMGVALAATRLERSVVDAALSIATFVGGIVLGIFLLGTLTKRVGQRAALIGVIAGLVVVSYVAFGPNLPTLLGRVLPEDLTTVSISLAPRNPRLGASGPSIEWEPDIEVGRTAAWAYPFNSTIAWPWWALIGSATVFGTGLLASLDRRKPSDRTAPPEVEELT